MFETLRLFGAVSRAEFILPNLGSLIMGLAWGVSPPARFVDVAVLVVLSFSVLNLSSAIGAQANTVSDYELDSRDERKKSLVQAENTLGRGRLKAALLVEFAVALVLVFVFTLVQGNAFLFLMWVVGISLGCAYSLPPFRLKCRSWVAPFSLILVLAVFPVFFAYFTFASMVQPLFILSLAGLALTVYGVIVPTEVRDFFGDREMDVETLTVRVGLVKASLLGTLLLGVGAALTGTAFLVYFLSGSHPWLSVFLIVMLAAVVTVLREFGRLHSLCVRYVGSGEPGSVAEEIMGLSARNPRWIMMVTQSYTLLSILLLIGKFW